jgi:hypothetical protein
MTDKEYVGLSVGGTIEPRQTVQQSSYIVPMCNVVRLDFCAFTDCFFTERRDCPAVYAAGKKVEDSHTAKTRWSGVLYLPVFRFIPVHDVSTSSSGSLRFIGYGKTFLCMMLWYLYM